MLTDWNATERALPATTLGDLFDAQVARTPDAVAVVFGEDRLTYAELDAAGQPPGPSPDRAGGRPGVAVGLGHAPSMELVVAMYAVVKAGGAYVPIDPDHPAERTAYVLGAPQPGRACSTTHGRSRRTAGASRRSRSTASTSARRTRADHRRRPARRCTPTTSAYVIYTSGSTGRPKGVAVTHARDRQPVAVDAAPVRAHRPRTWCCRRPRRPSTSRCGSSSGRCSPAPGWWSPRPDGHRDAGLPARADRGRRRDHRCTSCRRCWP